VAFCLGQERDTTIKSGANCTGTPFLECNFIHAHT
jgi:hypothetical protein